MNYKNLPTIIFWLLVILMSIVYSYPHELFQRPHGMHTWRQCDGAQFAANYYNVSMNFFAPRLSMLTGNDGKMVSEFPIIYYLGACCYKLFGKHDFFLRGISLLIFFSGLYFLFKSILILLKDTFYAIVLSLLIFTSPVLIDYANSFLPDVPALALTFIGYYFLLKFKEEKNVNSLWYSSLLVTLAGLIKISSLIGFFAITATFCINYLITFFRTKKIPKENFLIAKIGFFLFPILVCISWIVFERNYNIANNNTFYFTTHIRPYWLVSNENKQLTWARFEWQWLRMYLYRDFLNFLPIISLLCFLIPTKKNYTFLIWFGFIITISIVYFFLFFECFYHHDYYVICMLIVPVAACVILLLQLKEWKPSLFNSKFLKAGLLLLLLVMINHGRIVNKERDTNGATEFSDFRGYWNIEKKLDSLGITQKSKILSIGDNTSGASLYLMNRRGWTQYSLSNPFSQKDLNNHIQQGADYLFIYKDCEANLDSTAIQNLAIKTPINVNGIKIYKLL